MKNYLFSLLLKCDFTSRGGVRGGAERRRPRRSAPLSRRCSVVLPESYVADFDGRSSLLYRFNQKSMSTLKDVISLRFKSHQAEGVLLHGEGQRGDYITLELHRGRLDLYLNLGAFPKDKLKSIIVGSVLIFNLIPTKGLSAPQISRKRLF